MKPHKRYKLIIVSLFSLILIGASCSKDNMIGGPHIAPYLLPTQITDNESMYRFDYDNSCALVKYTKISNGIIEENTIEYSKDYQIVKRHYLLQDNSNDYKSKVYTYTYKDNTIYESDEEGNTDTLIVRNHYPMRYAKFSDKEGSGYNESMEYETSFRLKKIISNSFSSEYNLNKRTTEIQSLQHDTKIAPYCNIYTPRWFIINKLPYGKYWTPISIVEIDKESVYTENNIETKRDSSIVKMSYTYNQIDYPVTVVWTEKDISKTIQISYKDINGLWQPPMD